MAGMRKCGHVREVGARGGDDYVMAGMTECGHVREVGVCGGDD